MKMPMKLTLKSVFPRFFFLWLPALLFLPTISAGFTQSDVPWLEQRREEVLEDIKQQYEAIIRSIDELREAEIDAIRDRAKSVQTGAAIKRIEEANRSWNEYSKQVKEKFSAIYAEKKAWYNGWIEEAKQEEQIEGQLSYSHKMRVKASQPWQSSGVNLAKGQIISISVNGTWTCGRGHYGGVGAKGQSRDYQMKGPNLGALIGRIGGEKFLVGDGYTGKSPGSGVLEFAPQDHFDGKSDNGLKDNSGELSVTVSW